MAEMGLFIQKKQLGQLLPLLADTLETTISTYLTIPEIYIIVAHLADTKMNRLEVAITAGIYLVVYIFKSLILITTIHTFGKQSR